MGGAVVGGTVVVVGGSVGATVVGASVTGVCSTGAGTVLRVAAAWAATERRFDSKVVSTDPPYYDNIGYADLSDFFYVWLRRAHCARYYPDLLSTMLTPKADELVATPYPVRREQGEGRGALRVRVP